MPSGDLKPRRKNQRLKQYEVYYEMDGAWGGNKPLIMEAHTLMEVAVLAHYHCEVKKGAMVVGIIEKREKDR